MYIKIHNKIITTPIIDILNRVKSELNNGKLRDIKDDHKRNILVTCPHHKDGFESNPSCHVLAETDDTEIEAGTFHCFSCGYRASLAEAIGLLFDEDKTFGEEWLLDRFSDVFVDTVEYLPPIELNKPIIKKQYLDESILLKYDYYHPYMWHRKLSKEVVDKFRVGYDKDRNAITFPVYDEKHKLVMVTARSVINKMFYIPEDVEKPVYLLYDIIERGIKSVIVCESQINTLYARSMGYESIGLFGTGSHNQLQTLKKSGIRHFILCFDGDYAGRKGAERFKKALGNSVFITDVHMPPSKDLNDLSKDEFEKLLHCS